MTRERGRKKNGKGTDPVSPKARRANRHASQWAFAELHGLLAYKAALSKSSLAIKVDPDYTSQACPMCGYTDKRNRPGKGLLFVCQNAQCAYRQRTGHPYTLHADLVGARNIAMRTLLVRQDWIRTGVLSVRPDASDDETKAARLVRYARMICRKVARNVVCSLLVCSSRFQEASMTDNKTYFDIPGEKSRELLARRQEFVARGVASTMSVFAKKAEGAVIEDVDGNRYIDFAGGIGVMNIGHSRPEAVQAIAEQAAQFVHTCFIVMMYEHYVALAERIVKIVPGDFPKKAIFFNSGAKAVENAVKIARYATGKPAIITFDNGYHGRTLMTMTMTSKVKPYKHRFGPFASEVYRAPFPYPYRMNMTPQEASDYCIAELERMFVGEVAADQVAAIVIEPVQGEGAFMPPPAGFLRALQTPCET